MEKSIKRISITVFLMCFALIGNIYAQKALVLEKQYAKISLQSNPSGAKVYLNGKLICPSTPATVEIPYNGRILPGKKRNWDERKRRSEEASSIDLVFVKEGYINKEETEYLPIFYIAGSQTLPPPLPNSSLYLKTRIS